MKYKVGDKVRIKNNGYDTKFIDKLGKTKIIHIEFGSEMKIYCGYVATITEVKQDMNLYRIDLDNHKFMWRDEMFDETFDFEQLPVGEVFEYQGKKLKVEKECKICKDCYFDRRIGEEKNVGDCIYLLKNNKRPFCNNGRRYDGESVIFKEVNMEERIIKIDIDTAKKLYKGNDESLKTLALQAYTENELKHNDLPNTWDEFCVETKIPRGFFIASDSTITEDVSGYINEYYDKNILLSKESAEAHLALMQLEKLRDRYRQGWKPNWKDFNHKYCIYYFTDNLHKGTEEVSQVFLSFQSREIRDLFVKNFKDLIEQAKEYI